MNKQLKILDEELNSNNLTRVPGLAPKSEKSLFRALSLSVYFNENHFDEIMRILKLCLICSCRPSSCNPFPLPHSKVRFLGKFDRNQENIDMYFSSPELNCYVYDNLELASLAFQKKVILFTVEKDGYLQETLVTACRGKTKQPPIMMAKRGNYFFCVQQQKTRSVMMFIKENIINQLINLEGREHPHRHHKKSLSDCGEVMMFGYGDEQQEHMYEYPETAHSQTDQHHHHHSHHMGMIHYGDEYFYHQYGLPQPRTQRVNANVPPNQRHTGRLKFFDQNGNYGFIVVDGYGSDLFVHYDDLQKTGIPKERFLNIRNSEEIRFQFTCLEYDGKYKKSKKAVDLVPIANQY